MTTNNIYNTKFMLISVYLYSSLHKQLNLKKEQHTYREDIDGVRGRPILTSQREIQIHQKCQQNTPCIALATCN
jgi:hypothetical protein